LQGANPWLRLALAVATGGAAYAVALAGPRPGPPPAGRPPVGGGARGGGKGRKRGGAPPPHRGILARPPTGGRFGADAPRGGGDVRFCNLEAPLLDGGRPLFSTGVRLRSPTTTTGLLRHLGIDVVTLANNHLMDYGPPGLASTLEQLDSAHIAHVGAAGSLEE